MKVTLVVLLVLFKLGEITPIQHTTSKLKWELLLETIGTKNVEVISVTDDKVIFKADSENLKHLRKLLDSPNELQKNTLHALFCNDPMLAAGNSSNNPDTYDVKDNDWFRRVVSYEFIKQHNLIDVFYVMHSNVQFDEELLTTELQFTVPDIIPYLMLRLNLAKLQSAITDEKTLAKILTGGEPLITNHSHESPTKYAQVISKIISHENNYTINFIINNGAFAQALQAYKVLYKPPIIASDLNGLFIIDKQYLLKYLTPVFNGLVWSETKKFPIVFHAKRSEEVSQVSNHDINILIDTSGSMGNVFDAYINNIMDILDKLDNVPNWQIQITRFSSDSVSKIFSLKDGDTINDVKKYVGTFKAYGGTRLYCTVNEALIDIRTKLTYSPDLFSTLMIFTDGDNNEGCTENEVIDAASYLKVVPQFNMYAIGFGETDTGFQTFFKRLTEVGGFIHIKLDNPDGMTQLRQYIDLLTQKINVWEILQGELKLSVSRVPEGDVFVLNAGTKSNGAQGITIVRNSKDKFKIGSDDVNCDNNDSP